MLEERGRGGGGGGGGDVSDVIRRWSLDSRCSETQRSWQECFLPRYGRSHSQIIQIKFAEVFSRDAHSTVCLFVVLQFCTVLLQLRCTTTTTDLLHSRRREEDGSECSIESQVEPWDLHCQRRKGCGASFIS